MKNPKKANFVLTVHQDFDYLNDYDIKSIIVKPLNLKNYDIMVFEVRGLIKRFCVECQSNIEDDVCRVLDAHDCTVMISKG